MSDPTTNTQHLNQESGRCRSCGAAIEWVWLNGKPHPLNDQPDATGNIVGTFDITPQGTRIVKVLGVQERDARVRSDNASIGPERGPSIYKSHFATCPNAAEWRRTAAAHVKREKRDAHFGGRRRG